MKAKPELRGLLRFAPPRVLLSILWCPCYLQQIWPISSFQTLEQLERSLQVIELALIIIVVYYKSIGSTSYLTGHFRFPLIFVSL